MRESPEGGRYMDSEDRIRMRNAATSAREHEDGVGGEVDRDDIHPASKQDVEVYIRTYSTMLRSSGEIKLKALVQAHLNADSALHVNARSNVPDMSAFFYCVQRLPDSIFSVRRVLLGQSAEV